MLRFEQPLKIGRMQNQLLTIGFAQPHRLFHHRTSTTPPLYHPYSTTLLRSLRLKNSQTLRCDFQNDLPYPIPLYAVSRVIVVIQSRLDSWATSLYSWTWTRGRASWLAAAKPHCAGCAPCSTPAPK